MYKFLNGLRIVECASFIAGPSCALHLQQLGAHVIRIDTIGGGPDFRRWPITNAGDSLYWEGLNKGKQSIAIDLSRPEGRELAAAIVTAPGPDNGLFVTNFPRKGFLSHERLVERRKDLITVRVAGWCDGESAVDYTINAAAGIPYMTGSEANADNPVNHVLPAWDLITGAYAAFALLAAERFRKDTGEGQEVLVPLSDVAIASLGHMGQIAEVMDRGDRPRIGNALYGAFGRDFTTADGQRVMVLAITARQWSSLVEALGVRVEINAIERSLAVSFDRNEGTRFEYRDRLFPIIERAISSRDSAALRTEFETHEVCWSPYRTLASAMKEEPRFSIENPLFSMLTHPSGMTYPTPGSAATFTGGTRSSPAIAPRLGEHTDQILSDVLNLSNAEIGALHDAKVVGGLNG